MIARESSTSAADIAKDVASQLAPTHNILCPPPPSNQQHACHIRAPFVGFKAWSRDNWSNQRPRLLTLVACVIVLQANIWTTCNTARTFASSQQPASECNEQHQALEPILVTTSEKPIRDLRPRELTCKLPVKCLDFMVVSFSAFQQNFTLNLFKNKQLNQSARQSRRSSAARPTQDEQFHKNNIFISTTDYSRHHQNHCHYLASTVSTTHQNLTKSATVSSDATGAVTIVSDCSLSGFFYLHHDHSSRFIYYLHPHPTNRPQSTMIYRHNSKCDITSTLAPHSNLPQKSLIADHKKLIRAKRSPQSSRNLIKQDPFQSNASSLYVELLIVHDHTQYVEANGNKTLIVERTMQIANIMNAFYRQLNVFIALVGVVLWVEKDEIELLQDGDATLTNFLKYRTEKLLPLYPHDNAQLITSKAFNGSVVGKALKGPICTYEDSGGVNTDHSNLTTTVAVTIAHELGHNFGMAHDNDTCKCPDDKCIMSASSNSVTPIRWSSCSINYLEESRRSGLLDCLLDKPSEVFGPICGNGFVEEGEDCDLGELVTITKSKKALAKCNGKSPGPSCEPSSSISVINKCCDRKTCKFAPNATCAQGACCDLSKCSVYQLDELRVCRPRQDECDLEEVCDGSNEACPTNVYYHNGIECNSQSTQYTNNNNIKQDSVVESNPNRTRAYCYQGKCASHKSQCSLLWGPTAFVSEDICYEQNIHGNMSGNCGYDRPSKKYFTCSTEDSLCGMLFCDHKQPGDPRKTGKLQYGFESASILTMSLFDSLQVHCRGAIVDAGLDSVDPGLVPNGAACGDDRMCVKQVCTPVHDVLSKNWCPSDCNGNGICDNTGTCHCFDGTIGTSCYHILGLNFHLSILVYVIMFFIPIVALLIVVVNNYRKKLKIWWFLHNRKNKLMARDGRNQQRRPTRVTDEIKMSISKPMPINHQENLTRPFYELMLDPWKEQTNDNTKSTSFRVQPQANNNVLSSTNQVLGPNDRGTPNNRTSGNLKPVRAAPPPPVP